MATWESAAKARRDFATMIEGLTPEQLEEQSLCNEWTARGVLAHVTSFVETPLPRFFATIAKNKFNFDKASVDMANRQLARPTKDVLASLRSKATKSAALPMFPEEMTLSDVVIHTQDVRRPLGLDGSVDDEALDKTLEFLTTHKMATTLVSRPSLDGVKLVATDREWSFGEGAEISGTGEALVMALANRPVLDELTGDGVDRWR